MAIVSHPSAPAGWGVDTATGKFAKLPTAVTQPTPPPAPTISTPVATPTTDFQTYFTTEKAKGISPDVIKQTYANQQLATIPEAYTSPAIATPPTAYTTPPTTMPTAYTTEKQFYRVGGDIFEAGTGRHIGPTEWGRDWSGTAKEVPAPTGAQPITPTTTTSPIASAYDELPPEEKKAEDFYNKAIKLLESYETEKFDTAAEREKLVSERGLEKDYDRVNNLEQQITDMETALRNRETDLRNQLRAENATESQIQRELEAQLSPLRNRYRDVYAEYDIATKQLNRELERIDLLVGEKLSGFERERESQQQKLENLLDAYGLAVKKEERGAPQQSESPEVRTVGKDLYQWNPSTNKWELAVKGTTTDTEGGIGFSATEKKKLEQVGLGNAPREVQLNYLYGTDKEKNAVIKEYGTESKTSSGEVKTYNPEEIMQTIKDEIDFGSDKETIINLLMDIYELSRDAAERIYNINK